MSPIDVDSTTIGFPFATAIVGAAIASALTMASTRGTNRRIIPHLRSRLRLISRCPCPRKPSRASSVVTLVARRSRETHHGGDAHDVGIDRHAAAIEYAERQTASDDPEVEERVGFGIRSEQRVNGPIEWGRVLPDVEPEDARPACRRMGIGHEHL